ncbi:Undecaprenyl-diphosphatase BcrC [Neobacillus rhizosphaerae]|uniref:Undecaprenyl-diphosphatase BcrC n=1 Tax=Neobacillus rhizosphaerae TaxID=2880965 RepID=A0ABM9EPE0_9BACI|nr:undecaprenyl-diphosphatase [Neobacillus rhizosphaerae]CAH2714480.1 Undecaprenyl-diphosphatase BcrC [Neobacillus rhizosphaerae]
MSISQVNIDIFRSINDLGKEYNFLNPIAIFMADYMLYVLALGMLVYWFTRTNKNRMMVLQGGLAFILAEVLGKIAGTLYYHHQPFAELPNVNKLIEHSIDNAFPSDHSILFFSICFSFWLVRRKEGWMWLIFACIVGISRIWVGVHYPGDVLAGALIGMGSALFTYWLVPKLSFIKTALVKYEKVEQSLLPIREKTENKNF